MGDHYAVFGNILANSNELIKNIFSSLNFYNLLNAIQVCQSWAKIGNFILKNERRLHFSTMCLKEKVYQKDNEVYFMFDSESVFFMKSLPKNRTSVCLAICCQDIHYANKVMSDDFPEGTSFYAFLKSNLPSRTDLVIIPAFGVVGTDTVEEQSPENISGAAVKSNFNKCGPSVEYEDAPYVGGDSSWISPNALSFFIFPSQPGVTVQLFSLNENDFYKTYRQNVNGRPKSAVEISGSEFDAVCGLDSSESLKALLVFSLNLKAFSKAFVSAGQNRENDRVAIGGVVLEEYPSRNGLKDDMVGLAISGANVRAASVVVPSKARTEQELVVYLQKLKDVGLAEGHSMCFMLSCCGRGSHWYGRNKEVFGDEFCNVETRAFRRLFPLTPVVGLFGGGEIGNSFLSPDEDLVDSETDTPRKKRKKKQNLFHQYSTVFVLVSFL